MNPNFPRRRRGALSNDRDGNGTQLCKLMRLSECGHSLRFERGWRESELGRDEQTRDEVNSGFGGNRISEYGEYGQKWVIFVFLKCKTAFFEHQIRFSE